jgi:hypothetical protein
VELFSACCNIEDGPFVHASECPELRRNRFLALKIVVLMAEKRGSQDESKGSVEHDGFLAADRFRDEH